MANGPDTGVKTDSRSAKSEGEREQIKLQAAYANGIAIGLFLVGGLAIPASILINASDRGTIVIAVVIAIFCFGASPALHWLGRKTLKELDR